jgi:hypothetical protein
MLEGALDPLFKSSLAPTLVGVAGHADLVEVMDDEAIDCGAGPSDRGLTRTCRTGELHKHQAMIAPRPHPLRANTGGRRAVSIVEASSRIAGPDLLPFRRRHLRARRPKTWKARTGRRSPSSAHAEISPVALVAILGEADAAAAETCFGAGACPQGCIVVGVDL